MNSASDTTALATLYEQVNSILTTYHHKLSESVLAQAMAYTLKPKSKLVRPLLVACLAHESIKSPLTQKAIIAIELIHTYSLIHDDLPAMDNDASRRGQASCHVAYDESTAILAGDALLTEAFELLTTPELAQTKNQLSLCQILAQASGRHGMALGQWHDLHPPKQADEAHLKSMYQLKTGKLIEASIQMGIVCANRYEDTDTRCLKSIGQQLGIAFQLKDDLLDLMPEHTTGKPQFSDYKNNKHTYLSIYTEAELIKKLNIVHQQIHQKIASLKHQNRLLSILVDQILTLP